MLQHHCEGPPWLSAKDKLAWETDRTELSNTWQERDARSFDELENHLQYGYWAARYFEAQAWDESVEQQLQVLWPGDWDADKIYIRLGWDWGVDEHSTS